MLMIFDVSTKESPCITETSHYTVTGNNHAPFLPSLFYFIPFLLSQFQIFSFLLKIWFLGYELYLLYCIYLSRRYRRNLYAIHVKEINRNNIVMYTCVIGRVRCRLTFRDKPRGDIFIFLEIC